MLALPERRLQIVQITVRVAMCLDAEARAFMADSQAALIDGGLESMAKRRREMIAEAQESGAEAYVIVDSQEDQLLEQVGQALDALRVAEIVRQLYADLREKHEAWEVARAILAREAEVRQLMIDGVKAQGEGNAAVYGKCREETLQHVLAARPAWFADAAKLGEVCRRAVPRESAEKVLASVAVDDVRAKLVLELQDGEAAEYLGEVKKRIDLLAELESKQ